MDARGELHAPARPRPDPNGFWFKKVLPLLRRRLEPPRHYPPSNSGFGGPNVFQRVKSDIRLEDLANQYTDLEPSGTHKFKALCPLHDERTPSFHVDAELQVWYCFGACGRGGDVIELVRLLIEVGRW